MSKIVIIYDSKTGNTEKMAEAIAEGARSVEDTEVVIRKVGEAFSLSELGIADAVILGSPAHYANLTSEMRVILESIEKLSGFGKIDLRGKVGAAFGSYGWDGGWSIEKIFREFMGRVGMKVTQPILLSIGAPNSEVLEKCRELGKRVAGDVKR